MKNLITKVKAKVASIREITSKEKQPDKNKKIE